MTPNAPDDGAPSGAEGGADGDAPAGEDAPAHDRAAVRESFERIAAPFAATREHPWPEVEAFVDEFAPGAGTALDLGCGNGRHAELLAAHARRVVGVDASRGLLELAVERASERVYAAAFAPVQGDAAALPLVADWADVAVYVATLHHLPDRADRVGSLDELARVLAPGAPALVSAWSTAADRFDREQAFDTTVDWTLPGGETVPRFYHVYDPEEFRADLDTSALAVERVEVSSGNCYATVRGPRE